ncbi:MAG: tetratricopeptide repeat protein [Bacteroidales bacterium]|nr:tetratricopeptide repeat protein [Bacteroidales bacterium]MCF8402773.1 tetratricopeptide repeat protein [Bacteroidales bacterium]
MTKIILKLILTLFASLAYISIGIAENTFQLLDKLSSASGTERVDLLNQLSVIKLKTNPDSAINLALEALEISVDKKDASRKAESLFNIAEGHKLKGNNIRALDYFLKSFQAFNLVGDQLGVAKSSNSCGRIYKFLGDYSAALDYHLKALKIYEELNIPEGIASSMIYAGVAYRNIGNSDVAMDYYNKALETARNIDDKGSIIDALVSKGNIFWYDGENENALEHYKNALEIVEKNDLVREKTAGIYNNIGNVYRNKGEYTRALDYYDKAFEAAQSLSDKNLIAVILKNKGITYKLYEKYSLALEYFNESKDLAEEIRLMAVHLETLEELSETYALLGNYKVALDYYKQFNDLNKSAHNEQATNKISIMQLGYTLKDQAQKQTIREVDLNMKVLKERNIRNVIIFITLLAVSFIFILWSRYKLKLRTNLELRQLNTDLEKRVEERTKRLREENDRRKLAQEHAELANETKNRFLANISHEVRTPINAIIGFCDLTIKSNIDGTHRTNLQRIKDSTEHLLALIKDILDYSQIDEGHVELKKIPFDLKSLTESVVNAFYLDAKSKGIDLTLKIHDEVKTSLIGDKDATRQILYNLIGNALKFTDSGSVEVDVKCVDQECTDEQARLFFSVKDTGIGIPKLKQKLIFKDFTQEHESSTRKYGGAGLGLTISKHFVELMDGKIWVDSDKGEGSNFMFTLLLDVDQSKKETDKDAPPVELKKHHILIAEDNLLNAQVIVAFLNRLGHTSEVATNGREALEVLARSDFDAVLMDIEMPEMDGLQATKAIRNGEFNVRNPEIPIVALTAHALKDYEDKSFEAGMNHYLTKPVDIDQLTQVLQDI